MRHNQVTVNSKNYEDAIFLETLEALHNILPHIKFNTIDVVRYTKPIVDKLAQNEVTFGQMSRQYNKSFDLDLLNGKLEIRMQEQEMIQSSWTMQRFVKSTMYIHSFYPTGGCHAEQPFNSNQIKNMKKNDEECLLWCLIAYLHPAEHKLERVRNYNESEYIIETILPNVIPTYDLNILKQIQELI